MADAAGRRVRGCRGLGDLLLGGLGRRDPVRYRNQIESLFEPV